MKVKAHIMITDPEAFLKGRYADSINLFGNKTCCKGWVYAGEIELDLNVDTQQVYNSAIIDLDNKIANAEQVVKTYEDCKKDLLCLTFQPESMADMTVGELLMDAGLVDQYDHDLGDGI